MHRVSFDVLVHGIALLDQLGSARRARGAGRGGYQAPFEGSPPVSFRGAAVGHPVVNTAASVLPLH